VAAAIKDVLNRRITDPVAQPLALAVGAGSGAAVAALAGMFNPAASVFNGTAFGLALTAMHMQWQTRAEDARHGHSERWRYMTQHPEMKQVLHEMGITSHDVDRVRPLDEATKEARHGHSERWRYMTQHPEMKQVLHEMGITFDDVDRVRPLYEATKDGVAQVMSALNGMCRRTGLPLGAQTERAAATFYMRHCMHTPLLVLAGLHGQGLHVAAVSKWVRDQVDGELAAGGLPGPVLRNNGCVFMRLDEVNRALQGRTDFDVRRPDQEWQVQACPEDRSTPRSAGSMDAPPRNRYAASGAFDTAEPVQLRRRRQPSSPRTPITHTPAVQAPARSSPPALRVRHGTTLQEQLAKMASPGATHRDLQKISQDLANGRLNGHPVKVDGHAYTASDINIDGLSGRGAWRLLHRRDAEGYELVGIVDYHNRRSRWWTG